MKNIKLFLTLLVMTLSFTAVAQSSFYDANACAKVTNKKSACNQGTEPFYKFIAKFQSSASFREQRTYEYVDGEVPNGGFKAYKGRESATWHDVSKNMVCYTWSDGECDGTYTFERVNGKWYLTGYDAAC